MTLLNKNKLPSRLKQIPDCPDKMYIEGELPPEDSKYLSVVGSRAFTPYGKEACEKLINSISGYPIVIVSGLALGIDAIAHRAALKAGLKTIAVPGSGLSPSVLYPRSHNSLAKEIVKRGGALLSEFEPDTPAAPWTFPRRNRIMAGLADAVLVIEAERKSGTLITARLATEYNRDVFTVPGSIFSKGSEGTHFLIRLGATPITKGDELLDALHIEKKTAATENNYEDCSPEEILVLKALTEPIGRDDLSEKLQLDIRTLNTILSLMEIKAFIKEDAGKIYRI